MKRLALLWVVGACARAPAPPPESPPPSASLDAAIAEHDGKSERARARRRSLRQLEPEKTVVIAPAPVEIERPIGRQARVDVRFRDAELENVVRLLADAGRFQVVTDGSLSQRVSVDLRRVRPFDALLAIAEAHGVSVERRGQIVLLRGK